MPVPEITALARAVAHSNPQDRQQQGVLLDRILELQTLMERTSADDLALCLEIAASLARPLSEPKGVTPEGVLEIVAGLVSRVDEAFESGNAEAPRSLGPAARGAAEAQADHVPCADAPRLSPSEVPSPAPVSVPRRPLSPPRPEEMPLITDMVLGQVMVLLNMLSEEDVIEALHLQRKTGQRIGEAFVELGKATWDQVNSAVRLQEYVKRSQPTAATEAPDPSLPSGSLGLTKLPQREDKVIQDRLLGEILVRLKCITREECEKGLQAQRATGLRIGEMLVQLGHATWDEVDRALDVQKRLRYAAGLSNRVARGKLALKRY